MAKRGDQEMLLTRKEAANYLRCSISTLAKKAMNEPEALPYALVGNKALYRKTDLDHYLKRHGRGFK